jgi:hypothetical protein
MVKGVEVVRVFECELDLPHGLGDPAVDVVGVRFGG